MKITYLLSSFFLLIGWILPVHFPPWQTSYQEFIAAIALPLLLIILLKNNNNRLGGIDFFLLLVAVIPMMQSSQDFIIYSGDMLHSTMYIVLFSIFVFI